MIDNAKNADRSNRLTEGLIGVPDPDAPIYRIFPLWFLEEALRLCQLVLVPPHMWEDPFEVVGNAIAINRREGGRWNQVIINQSLPPVFAQCWSATAESDALLRAYSRVVKDSHFSRNICPRDEGVRVRSTPRKLLRALIAATESAPNGSCYIGFVRYHSQSALLQEIANAIGQHGNDVFSAPINRAKLLLLKREAFSHEAEVRLIYVRHHTDPPQPLLHIPIDPVEVFDEITFDPRLVTFERKERESVVRSLGYTGSIGESLLYQRTLLEVVLNDK
jgi:hypothetical protein